MSTKASASLIRIWCLELEADRLLDKARAAQIALMEKS